MKDDVSNTVKRGIYVEITPFFPTEESFRGPYIYDQVQALKRTKHFSEVLVLHPSSLFTKESYYEYNGIRVYQFPCIESPSYLLNGIFDPINQWLFKRWWHQMKWDTLKVEVAHAHVSTTAIYPLVLKAMNAKIITVVQHHDLDPFTIRNGKWADKKWNLFYRARRNSNVFGQIDYHVCVSEKVKDSLLAFPQARQGECYESYLSKLRKLSQWSKKPCIQHPIVLYNAVETSKFYPMERKENALFTIGCIANFVELKGHQVLLRALRILVHEYKIKDIRLSLIGSGPLLESCKAYTEQQQLSGYVTFESEVQHSELCRYYNTLDLFVLPSYFEGFGCVFTEAAACGVPFMTCKDQGVENYIPTEERYKWLFPVNDHCKLAELIAQYKAVPEKQKLALSWNIDELIANYLKEIGK